MWPIGSNKRAQVFFTDTLSGEKKEFVPITKGKVRLYSCGPTVYGAIHIGNLRSFVLADLVARTLKASGYKVERVMNITDVGHMVGDGDAGDDKLAVGAAREKTTPKAVADKYTKLFMEDIKALGIDTSDFKKFPRATSYIQEDIEMIKALEKKGYTYLTSEGLYFDTTKFPNYGSLLGMKDAQLRAGVRVDMGEKKSPHDFVLWRTAKSNDLQKWNSPWGEGNPGWSIECSAMATALLGTQIDIHTGGEDLASVHHNNEIAQSEAASGKHPFSRYWIHGAFLTMNGEKLAKSAGNSFTLADVVARGIHPLALRYLFLQAHYRSPLSFSWDALAAADTTLQRLWKETSAIKAKARGASKKTKAIELINEAAYDDLATPQVIAQLWMVINDTDLSSEEKWAVIEAVEKLLGLSLTIPPRTTLSDSIALSGLPEEIRALATGREEARKNKDFAKSDELRIHLSKRGYAVEDTPSGTTYTKIGG